MPAPGPATTAVTAAGDSTAACCSGFRPAAGAGAFSTGEGAAFCTGFLAGFLGRMACSVAWNREVCPKKFSRSSWENTEITPYSPS